MSKDFRGAIINFLRQGFRKLTSDRHRPIQTNRQRPKLYTGWPKNGSCSYALTSSDINRFSKIFHRQNQEKIYYKFSPDSDSKIILKIG